MSLIFLLPAALALQGQVQVRIGAGKENPDSVRMRAAALEARLEEVRDDTTNRRRPARRIELTPRHLATAFRDSTARSLLTRARVARLRQDTSLLAYDAKSYERVSVGLGVKMLGRERLAFRHEDAARVRWSRAGGVRVEMTGSRTVAPIANNGGRDANANMTEMAPIPYYPGRDNLWVGSGLARAEVDDRELVHPLAVGAEAYYTYETGDSVSMRLPDGKTITLREMRIAAREPKWNVSVGSFWFDESTAQLVRAVYRLSMPIDILAAAKEESERAKTDTSAAAARRRRNGDADVPGWLRPIMSPMKADISGITIEYGLYNQRFWLPRAYPSTACARAGHVRAAVHLREREWRGFRAAGVDSVLRDSLVRVARRARARELVQDRERQCAAKGTHTTIRARYEGTLRVAVEVPCDSAKLASSPDLPPSIYDANEELFGVAERDALVKALSFSLQPGWGPQRPQVEYGLAQTRYNRVEGLSTGVVVSSALGLGYSAALGARASYADRTLNGELGFWRSNGRATIRGNVYRRLVASDDWGNPLSFGASMASLLYARDEGSYYRAWGAELTRMPAVAGGLEWRLFGERQSGDSVHSRWTLFGGGNDPRFLPNPVAPTVTAYGGAMRIRPQWGLNPDGFRVMADFRAEAAGGDSTYARGLFDLTLTTPVGPVATALTLSGGAAAGGLPLQRQFRLGGLQTVRGQSALTAAGDAYWLVRGEIGTRNTGARTVVFGDLGWAGARANWNAPGRPLSGVGIGQSFLDGLIRVDVSRGLWPRQQWRLDLQLDAKF